MQYASCYCYPCGKSTEFWYVIELLLRTTYTFFGYLKELLQLRVRCEGIYTQNTYIYTKQHSDSKGHDRYIPNQIMRLYSNIFF